VSGSKDTHSHVLIARAGSVACAIAIEHVVETMRPLPVAPIGHAPAGVRGLALIRGEPTPVLDATELLGGERGTAATAPDGSPGRPLVRTEAPASSSQARFVVVRAGARRVALAFDAVLDVRWLPRAELAALPPLVAAAGREVVAAIGRADAALLVVLEVARALDAATWEQLDAEARA
jgi:purine-binding chemotaxis protein CheW